MNENPGKETRPLDKLYPEKRGLNTRRGMLAVGLISALFIGLAGIGAWLIAPLFFEQFQQVIEPPASLEEVAEQYPELAGILLDPQLDSAYKDIFIAYEEGGPKRALELARRYGLVDQNNDLRLTLELDTNDSAGLVQQLEATGIKITAVSDNLVDIAIPLSLIEQAIESGEPGKIFAPIQDLEHIIHIRLPRKGIRQVSNSGGESLPVISADEWQGLGFTGKGIKIGVLDLGFDKYRDLIGEELPEKVTARSFISGVELDQTGEPHGTAVAEVIYDIAPEAELFFAAYSTDAEQRLAVDWLVSQDVNIISHSVRSIYGPMDGSGDEAKLVERTVAKNVLWVNCAGNDAETHYWGVFVDENGDGFHEFRDGDQFMSFNPVGRVRMALNWDAWDRGDQDYDLILYDRNKNKIVSSENIQNDLGDDAAEFIEYGFSDEGPYYIAFFARRITRPGIFNFFIYEGENLEYKTPEYSITSPADSEGSLSVGATYWSDDVLESYSSLGPTLDGRIKPDISAPTGVNSVTYGEPFYGTSASAPHVSAAAALVWQAHPEFSPQMVIDFLQERAVDLGPEGEDNSFGAGRLWLGEVAEGELAPLPATPTQHANPTQTPMAAASPTPLSTETRVPTLSVSPTPLPDIDTGSSSTLMLVLGLVACVAFPGVVGLSGIGFLGYLSYLNYREVLSSYHRLPAVPQPGMGKRADEPAQESMTAGRGCPRCGTKNRSKARFCRYCGVEFRFAAALEAGWTECQNCGKYIHPGSRYCRHCGRRTR
ncbi:MAG: hypothetical protein A2Z16_09190 [Chloroflexi bacterium RBG_16_54_18]|nr:MAG: hypothetical protein A2Z16_09190 [Chloroflexi bacterium RBG_16_54_18]